jgi:hypothetical protein
MVNWQDPVTIITEFGAFCSISFYAALSCSTFSLIFLGKICKTLAGAFVKLIHVVDGIYMCVLLVVPLFANSLDKLLLVGSLFATLALSGVYFGVGVSGDGPVLWASLATNMETD